MSSEWQTVLLGDVAELSGGYAFKSEEYTESGHFVLRTVNITDDGRIDRRGATFVSLEAARKYERFALKPFDTLFVMVGATLGKTGFVKTQDLPALLNQNMWLIRAKPSLISPLYLHYAFKVFSQPLLGMASGSARGFVKRDDFRQMIIPLPSAPEQVRISSLLGALDDRITLLRETNATLEAIAQALFKSWFVDFDPVRAKQEGRAPEGMSDATAALFPDSFEESELGLLPKGWRISTVADLCSTITNGGTPSRSKVELWEGGTIPWFKTGEFNDGFLLQSAERITRNALATSAAKLLPENSVLMAIYAAPTVGRLGVLTEPSTFNQACTGMVAKETVGVWFLFWTLYFGRDWFNSRANGAAQQNISKAIVSAYRVVSPSDSVLLAFNEIATSIHHRIRRNSEQAQTLATLRDTLLPRLISGQLRLPEAEALIEEATA